MRKSSKLYAKKHGLISLYLFVPIFTVLFLSVSICFSLACKQAEFNIVRTKNLAIENIFLQTEAIVFQWFQNAIYNGDIVVDFSSIPADNAVIEAPAALEKEVAAIDKSYSIETYVIDENYSASLYVRAGKIPVNQNTPIYIYDALGGEYYSKRYSIICEVKSKFNKASGKYISCTQVIVFKHKGIFTVNRLHSRRNYILE